MTPAPETGVGGSRYETARDLTQRIGHTDTVVCMDCGAFVMNVAAHDRHHAAMSGTDVAASRLPDGTWSCVKDGTTEPCGECGGCRSVQAENRAAGAMTDCGAQAGGMADEGSAAEAEFLEWLNESPAPMRAAFMAWRAKLEQPDITYSGDDT